jgi:hypothetical protein
MADPKQAILMETVVKVRVQCPECANKFYSKSVYGVCPYCGHEAEEPDDTVIQMPSLRSATTKATDQVYRDMETSSIHRAEQAAAMAGVPVSEMSHLKITNLRDNVLPGETYAMPVRNAVTDQMERMKAAGMPVGMVGSQYAGDVKSGFAPNAGANMLDKINPNARSNKLGATFK